ncbi:putative ABC transporter permease [Breznakiella homolactica]|uniref:Putative ABC transporter permease n=1 Tax=Breznakiella homolactica TaxID=2798577 RepID=A0A7T7XMV5_9SPIR|nr:putative ABC transporter permease [Breznakiella homolactica]QQO09203.1 putative ABC transporter permease [Breznakiella homolactica]
MIPQKVLDYLLYFALMSFVGWILETCFRSFKEKHFVNAGFLSGPFVPIYGFGAVIITMISVEARTLPPVLGWIVMLLSPTVLEYVTSWAMEKLFGLKLWDYSHNKFNINGRISLKFSICWAALAVVLVAVIQPAVFTRINLLGPYLSHFLAGAFLAYFVTDVIQSVKSVYNFKQFQADLAKLIEKGREFKPSFDIPRREGKKQKLPPEIRRIMKPLSAFPALRKNFKPKFSAFPDWIRERLEERFGKDTDDTKKPD